MALQCPFRLLNRHFKLSPGEKKVEDWKIARERLLMEARRYSMKIKVQQEKNRSEQRKTERAFVKKEVVVPKKKTKFDGFCPGCAYRIALRLGGPKHEFALCSSTKERLKGKAGRRLLSKWWPAA
jgi:hypothetical protein